MAAQTQIRIDQHDPLEVPVQFLRLRDIAFNFWWSWSHPARELFATMDPWSWERYRNPIELLLELDQEHWHRLQNDRDFIARYQDVVARFDAYLMPDGPTWFEREFPDYDQGAIAYFSTEFGWHESLHSYSGGLGVLSGDHSKSASDLGLPFVGVGLMYRRGYFHQTIDSDGNQQHFYPNFDLSRLPLRKVLNPDGSVMHVHVELPGRRVEIRAWMAQIGRVPVLLLDTDFSPNHAADRAITSILYINGREMRLCQEIVLGIGGARVLDALGIRPAVWHMNEGHSALLSLERIARLRRTQPMGIDDAARLVSNNSVFTTHTPVTAGNEIFDTELVSGALADWAARTDMPMDDVLGLGVSRPEESGFNMTALAIRTSRQINGVSKLHGEVSTGMWRHLLAGRESEEVGHVTNGVHLPTWIGPAMDALLRRHLGEEFRELEADEFEARVLAIPDEELWAAHFGQKQRLLELMRERARDQLARHGRSPAELRQLDGMFDTDRLTIGFARRFATYKRAALLLRDMERIKQIVHDAERPVQFIFAGKAHPADRPGQELIRQIWQAAASADLLGRFMLLENYDMQMGRFLVGGVDVWLNTPMRPMEASGTSGMKAAMNGGLNCSVLDGWWCEGYDASHGWAIGGGEQLEGDAADQADADWLYDQIGSQIAPCYYDRDGDGLPRAWIERMKRAIGQLSPRFSTTRMVRDYTRQLYVPATYEPARR